MLKDGQSGNVELSSPTLMKRYWPDSSTTSEAMTAEGWVRSGDIGYFARDGQLHMTGRVGTRQSARSGRESAKNP